jgi:ABC-type multidrug transport system permease subunit
MLIASSLCGVLWMVFGSMITFLITAAIALIVLIYLAGIKSSATDIQ